MLGSLFPPHRATNKVKSFLLCVGGFTHAGFPPAQVSKALLLFEVRSLIISVLQRSDFVSGGKKVIWGLK